MPWWLYCVHWQTQPLWLQASGREMSPRFPAQTLSLLKSALSSQLTHCHLGQVTTVSKPTHHCTESVRQSFKYLFWFVIRRPQNSGPAAVQERRSGGHGGTKLVAARRGRRKRRPSPKSHPIGPIPPARPYLLISHPPRTLQELVH